MRFVETVGDSIPGIVVGFLKGPVAPSVGTASILLGVAESPNTWVAPVVGIGGGTALLILAWFANAIKNVMERWLEAQGQKLIDLPTAAALAADKKSLTAMLEEFASAASKEREEMHKFRLSLADTLADHRARIRHLEGRKYDTGEVPRNIST